MDKMEVLDIIREERKRHTNPEYDYDEERTKWLNADLSEQQL